MATTAAAGAFRVYMILAVILTASGASLIGVSFAPSLNPPSSSGQPNLAYTMYSQTNLQSSGYKVYGNPSLGIWAAKLVVINNGQGPAYNLQINWKVENFTGSDPHTYNVLMPGSSIVDLYYPILPASVVALTTSTPSNIRFDMSYQASQNSGAQTLHATDGKPINIIGGHDIIFSSLSPKDSLGTFYDDFSNYQFIATLTTVTDPVVLQFAAMAQTLANTEAGGSINAYVQTDKGALWTLQGIWDLSVYNGISYKIEPQAFWTGHFSEYIEYPRDVLQNHIGTCIDTAVFIATVAEALGMKAYVYVVPGHAFPVIRLPESGNLVPIESTTLSDGFQFSDAVTAGIHTWNTYTTGPYLRVDIETFQGKGYTPPELPTLPTTALSDWGYKQRPTQTQTTTPYQNQSPAFSFSYPSTWTISHQTSAVSVSSSADSLTFVAQWAQGYSTQQVRTAFETAVSKSGTLQQSGSDQQVSLSGVQTVRVIYSFTDTSGQYVIVARYAAYQGYGFVVAYEVPNGSSLQNLVTQCEQVVASFKFG
jgi:hypothetical protein